MAQRHARLRLVQLSFGAFVGVCLLAVLALTVNAAESSTEIAEFAPPGRVLWQADGVPVSVEDFNQKNVQIVRDRAGGAVMVWEDYRNDRNYHASDLYAQRVNRDGQPMWAENGVPVSLAPGVQWWAHAISDGAGGVIAVWSDYRAQNFDIYAQRISPDGEMMWQVDGAPVATSPDNDYYPSLTSDGSGGAIITWEQDYDSGKRIRAQRVRSNGVVAWTANGIEVGGALASWWHALAATDGADGAFITWFGYCEGAGVCIQHINSTGVGQWRYGLRVGPASGSYGGRITHDGAGGVIVVWVDDRELNKDIYAQRVDSDGNSLWKPGGSPVIAAAGDQQEPALISDEQGGAIFAWQDSRQGDWDIYTQRLSLKGIRLWSTEGIAIANRNHDLEEQPQVVSDRQNGAIVTWVAVPPAFGTVYAQRIRQDGTLAWQKPGVMLCNHLYRQGNPQIVEDGSGGAIVAWQDDRRWYKDSNYDIYAQRVSEEPYSLYVPLVQRGTGETKP